MPEHPLSVLFEKIFCINELSLHLLQGLLQYLSPSPFSQNTEKNLSPIHNGHKTLPTLNWLFGWSFKKKNEPTLTKIFCDVSSFARLLVKSPVFTFIRMNKNAQKALKNLQEWWNEGIYRIYRSIFYHVKNISLCHFPKSKFCVQVVMF